MYNFFESIRINLIRFDQDHVTLWIPGGTVTITDNKEIEVIRKAISFAKSLNFSDRETCDYVRYELINYGG